MLEVSSIAYTWRWTSSENYISEWVAALNLEETPYTDFIMIGGDGILNQFMNSVAKREDSEEIFRIPIGILPGGSTNATAWDLSGKNPVMAWTNVLRGQTIEADIMKVTFSNNKSLLTTTVTWGVYAEIVHDAEGWRRWFGSWRYNMCGLRYVTWKWKLKTYKADIMFKNEEYKEDSSAQVGESFIHETNRETKESFEPHNRKDFTFFSIVSHECRSSNDNAILAPFARYSDQKLNFVSAKVKNRFGLIYFSTKIASKGGHMKLNNFEAKRATEAIIRPSNSSWFNLDGEIYKESEEWHIKIIPRYLRLIGKLHEKTESQQKYTETLKSVFK